MEICYSRASILVMALALVTLAAVTFAFETWSFGWFAWAALGLAAVAVISGRVLHVLPDGTTDKPVPIAWPLALLIGWFISIAAMTDAPSLSFFLIGIGGIAILPDLTDYAIGPRAHPGDENHDLEIE